MAYARFGRADAVLPAGLTPNVASAWDAGSVDLTPGTFWTVLSQPE